MESAADALEFKLNQVLTGGGELGVEGKRRAVDAVLGIIAQAPALAGQAGQVKTQLMVTRIARLRKVTEVTWGAVVMVERKTKLLPPPGLAQGGYNFGHENQGMSRDRFAVGRGCGRTEPASVIQPVR